MCDFYFSHFNKQNVGHAKIFVWGLEMEWNKKCYGMVILISWLFIVFEVVTISLRGSYPSDLSFWTICNIILI